MDNAALISAETIELAKKALLQKDVSQSTNLVSYDLQGPAKNIYPTITPIRNRIPRIGRTNPGDAVRWRPIFSITGSGYDNMGWIPEGQRSASMSYGPANTQTAPYVTLGEEDRLTFEAESAAAGFEDVNATLTLRLLQKTMRKEEMAILGGNRSLVLPTQAAVTPTVSASGSGGTLVGSPTTFYVVCVPLTFEGWKNTGATSGAAVAVASTKVGTATTFTGNDGLSYTLQGGSGVPSLSGSASLATGNTLFASIPSVQGAFGYAWFVGTTDDGTKALQRITTLNSVAISVPLATGTQAFSTITGGDHSVNASLAFDGLLNIAANPANNAYVNYFATGTSGTGTFLTPSGRGSVMEIDNALQAMWDQYRLSPTALYVNSQEQRNITNKCLSNASGPLLRFNVNDDGGGSNFTASNNIRFYYNPFSIDGGQEIPILVHPDVPPGTILGFCERLPVWYQNNNVDVPFAMQTRRDYYRVDWPLVTRQRAYGVYLEEVLVPYAPFAAMILSNVGNG